MTPFSFPSLVVQKVVAIGIDCGVHTHPIAQEPSGFFESFLPSNRRLVSFVSSASPEELPMTFRVSLGRDKEVILALPPSGDISLGRGAGADLPVPLSGEVSLVLETGTTLGEVTSLCRLVFTGGLRSP